MRHTIIQAKDLKKLTFQWKRKLEPQGALIAHLSTMSTSVIS